MTQHQEIKNMFLLLQHQCRREKTNISLEISETFPILPNDSKVYIHSAPNKTEWKKKRRTLCSHQRVTVIRNTEGTRDERYMAY